MFSHSLRGDTSTRHKLSALLAAAGISLALAVAGCGGNSAPSTQNQPAASGGATTTQGAGSSSTSSGGSSGIPQGKNAGDKDADNNGGPSDGDGNI